MYKRKSDLTSFLNDASYVDLDNTGKDNPLENPLIVKSVETILKKSVIQPGFESLERAPGCLEHRKELKNKVKKERAKCKGPNWFNMTRPNITPEIENDLRVIQMRSVLDPKRFYKSNDIKGLPKYFQVGRYVDAPADFYSSRLPKKQRKRTIVEELLADEEFRTFNNRKYKERIHKYKELNRKQKHSKIRKNKSKQGKTKQR